MEKQRIKTFIRSGRRFLISLLLLLAGGFAFSQNITAEQLKQLKLVPEEEQNLYIKTDIKFLVTIPNVRPAQIQVLVANQQQDITFRTMRKIENYENNGTTIEIWYNFATKGTYTPSPLPMMIQNKRRSISFETVTVTDDPATMTPRIVLVFQDGTKVYSDETNFSNPLLSVPTGQKLDFTVNIQYAMQLVHFNWEIPKDSIFTCTKQFEFTEVRHRERVYSHTLIPVASFEWTGLVPGPQTLPKIRLNATGYNGYRSDLLLPEIVINFTEELVSQDTLGESDIFYAAFYQDETEPEKKENIVLTKDECVTLCNLYKKENSMFFTYFKARKDRINYEREHGIVVSRSPVFPAILLYIAIIIILSSLICLIVAVRKKHKIRTLLFVVMMLIGIAIMIYCAVRIHEHYGISSGCKIYSIPQENADSVSEVISGTRVRILEHTGKWYYIEVGETGGWCTTENVNIIR